MLSNFLSTLIYKSMSPLEYRARIWELSKECIRQYDLQKKVWGDEFDSRMAEICAEITMLQKASKKPEGVSFADATLALLFFDENELKTPEQAEIDFEMQKEIMAAFAWHSFEQSDLENALREIG